MCYVNATAVLKTKEDCLKDEDDKCEYYSYTVDDKEYTFVDTFDEPKDSMKIKYDKNNPDKRFIEGQTMSIIGFILYILSIIGVVLLILNIISKFIN